MIEHPTYQISPEVLLFMRRSSGMSEDDIAKKLKLSRSKYLSIENGDEKISQNRLIIINSNGAKVFEANNYQNNWDASNVLNGSYFYVLETKVDGKTQSYYGSIQIIR
jgi:transcriptional regulator with XRE-family HTH domain